MKPNTPKWKNSTHDKRLKYTIKTTDENVLFEIAKCDVDSSIVLEAVKNINDPELLKKLLLLPLDRERFGCLMRAAITCPFYDNYEESRIAIINKINDLSFLLSLDREAQTYCCRPYQMGFDYENHGTHIIEALNKRILFLQNKELINDNNNI